MHGTSADDRFLGLCVCVWVRALPDVLPSMTDGEHWTRTGISWLPCLVDTGPPINKQPAHSRGQEMEMEKERKTAGVNGVAPSYTHKFTSITSMPHSRDPGGGRLGRDQDRYHHRSVRGGRRFSSASGPACHKLQNTWIVFAGVLLRIRTGGGGIGDSSFCLLASSRPSPEKEKKKPRKLQELQQTGPREIWRRLLVQNACVRACAEKATFAWE